MEKQITKGEEVKGGESAMDKKEAESDAKDVFGEVIVSYTRAQAIEDGVLVDVSEMAREAGIVIPTAVTRAVWDRYVQVPKALEGCQDEKGRLWDILFMLRHAVKSQTIQGSEGCFQLHVQFSKAEPMQPNEKRVNGSKSLRLVTLRAVCGPADNGSACMTVLLPDED